MNRDHSISLEQLLSFIKENEFTNAVELSVTSTVESSVDDSIDLYQLFMALEDFFETTFTDDELDEVVYYSDLLGLINEKLKQV